MIDIEIYTMDQRFRKGLHRFIEWWTLLARKKGGKRSVNKVEDIGGLILYHWENLKDDKKRLVYSQRFPYKTILDMHRYNDYLVFTKKDDNDCFFESLSKLKK